MYASVCQSMLVWASVWIDEDVVVCVCVCVCVCGCCVVMGISVLAT